MNIERSGSETYPLRNGLSRWSVSLAKRVFDAGCVLLVLPALAPLALLVAALVRFTSPGPVLFRQKRVGRHGRVFTILKFRTMAHAAGTAHPPITTLNNQPFTPVGAILRRFKLDELPQFLNVLLGHMSLVGPRPKIAEHTIFELACRPGLTGMATLAFAEEEALLSRVPREQLRAYFHEVVLPAKHRIDSEYSACATFFSDLRLLARSVLRRWDRDPAGDAIPAARRPSPSSVSFYEPQESAICTWARRDACRGASSARADRLRRFTRNPNRIPRACRRRRRRRHNPFPASAA